MTDPVSPPQPPSDESRRKRRLVPDLSHTIDHGGERLTRVARVDEESPRSLDEVARKHLEPEVALAIQENVDFIRKLGASTEPTESPIGMANRIEVMTAEADADAAAAQAETDAAARAAAQAKADAAANAAAQAKVDEMARRIEIMTDGAVAVPHPEADAAKRPGTLTVSPVVGLEDAPDDFLAGKGQPTTLFDLFSLFPLLDGVNWWILVDRKEPKIYLGRKVAGYQRPITSPLTLADWQDIYGGGTYKLTVYGPPKRGGVMQADGRVAAVKMTEPITVVFPGVPSSESEDYNVEDPMTASPNFPNLAGRRGPASMADAQIEKERLSVDAAREIRQETQVDRERSRAEAALKEKARAESDLLGKFMELQDKAAEREADLREAQVQREREIAEERRANDAKWEERFASERRASEERIKALLEEKKQPDDLEKLHRLSTIISKPDNSEMLREQHARELERVQASAKADTERAADRVREEQKRADLRIEEAAGRVAERIREIEKRAADSEREIRDRSDREVSRIKEEADRRVNDMHRQHTDAVAMLTAQHSAAMTAEARNHERDMNALKAQHAMALDSLKNSYDMRLETARGEVKRTLSEVDRWKQEAESGKDVVGRMRKLKEDAAELGMVEAGESPTEPETVPQMLMKTGMGVVQNLPAIIENIGGMFKARSAQELQQARLQGRQDMVDQAGQGLQLPSPHARRRAPALGAPGGYVPRHMSEVSPMPMGPSGEPISPALYQQQQAPAFQPSPEPLPMPAPIYESQVSMAPAPFPGHTGMPPEPQMRPSVPPPPPTQIQVAPPSSPPVAAASVDPADTAVDRQILQAEQVLLPQYTAGVSPAFVAEHMFAELGREQVTGLVQNMDPERVILAITRTGDPSSPFLRRDGKKYLRALFDELKKKVAG